MVILSICLLVLFIVLICFILSTVTLSFRYEKTIHKNELEIKVQMWWGMLHYGKNIKLGEPMANGKKAESEEGQEEEQPLDEMDGSFHALAKLLSDLKEYRAATKEVTTDIRLTNLEISLSYGTGNAPTTAMATGILWGIVGTGISIIGRYFQLEVVPKTEVVPYFMMKKPLELYVGCIGKIKMANAIRAIWKLARFMQSKKQLHKTGGKSHKGKNQMA